ncbi:phage tail spike protein [Bacillus mycoides]|uniref:phage tail spike protein n=1 Tax=Bacillus mycoides TaxID=1405 RepID=UPI000992D81A|nr:phage tail spike protein [Bacillus mycoides]OOR20923.1 hypothetical protein BW891_03285 [Bacillus mycoides]
MRTPSGELHVVDFKTEQIVASIQPKDYRDDKRHWEIKNNIDTLEFRVFDNTRHSATLMQQNLVLKEVRDGRIVPYVITEIEKDSDDRSVIAYASGEWIQLSKAGIISPQRFESKTAHELTAVALAGTKYEIGNIEYSSFRTMIIDEFIDPLSFIKKIASLFELEIQYRIEVVGTRIKRYVDMIKKRGRETGKEVTLGKDLMEIKRIENSQNICTALLGFVKKEGGEFVTITEINNGVPYLVDGDAYQRWNEKGQHKFGFYSPETEDQDMNPKRLMTLMNTELKKRVNTSVLYEVGAQSIGRVFGLAHELINEGDTIKIKDTGFTPKLYLEARVIAGDESFTDPTQDKYVFGDYREIVDPNEESRKIYNRILSSLGNKQEMIDQLDKLVKEANETASNAKKESEAAKTLAEKVQENIKNNTVEIIEAKNPPTTGLQPNKTLWRDISNGKPGILKIWTGTAWESVVPDVESVKKETLEQVTRDINNTKQELDKKVETLKTETETLVNTQIKEVQTTLNDKVAAVKKDTETISDEILNIKKDVSGKVDGEFVKNQIKDKADKSGVFTKEEINNGFIGKQIYETDKQGNVKKFQEISTSVEQTNESIKSLATKQSVTDLGNNITQVSKTANEAKQTADGNTRTISQVDSKVNQTATDFTKKTTAIEETVNGVSTKVTNIQTEQGKISERVTKSEQTADGFKTSIESLTKKDSDISSKLNTVESTVEGTKKTISDVQQTTNDLKKTTIEITEKAGKISEKLESVEKKFDDIKIGGQNFYKQKSFGAAGGTSITYDDSNKWWNITIPAGSSGSWKGILYNTKNATLLVGRTYTISYEIYADEVIPTAMDINNFGVTTVTGTNDNDVVAKRIMRTPKTIAGQWVKVSATFIMPDNITQDFYDNSVLGVGGGWTPTKITNIKIRNMQLEEGNIPTSYRTPSEDQVSTDEFNKKTTDIEKSIDGVKTSVSTVQKEQDNISKRVTNAEQTAEGFKKSIESLNTANGTISNKLNKVEETVEGTKKTISDVQQTTNDLKKTTTEITEKAGKISEKLESVEKKVTNDKAGGRNLLLDSNVKYEKTDYLINQYTLSENFSAGEEYTFVIKGSVPQGQKLGIWQNGGSNNVGYATSAYASRITYVTFKAVATTVGNEKKLSLYNAPQNITKATVEWVALYKGNKPQDWTPAPENQVTTDEFTKKTTEIEKSVDGVKTNVTNVQNSQVGFEKRMTTVEQTASGLSSTVTNLNNVVDSQGKKLTEASTKIEQQATAIGAKVEIKQVEDYVAGFKIPDLKNTVNKNKEDLLAELANKLATEQFNQKVTQIDNRFTINEKGINASAKTTEVYTKEQANGQFATSGYVRDMESRLQLTEKGVSISVKENDVIAAFNMSKENIKLNAARIDLVGKVKAEWLMAGLLSGCQIRTSNTNNYVSLDDQFLRLYESGVPRAFLGYYRRRDGAVQPTFILGSDEKTSAPEGTLFISQMGTGWSQASANIGITDDIVDSEIRKSVFWELNRNGISVLHANDYHALYAGNGNWYFRRGKSGLYQSTLAIEDNSSDADLRLPNITLRNSRVAGYTGVLQVKSSVTQNGWGAVQGNFMSPSLREYKSNIRDVSFSALEKIRNIRVREFNYKNAVNELYKMREEKNPNNPPVTTQDIKKYYGAIVDESDEAFVDESGKGIHLYSYASLTIKALQELEEVQNEKIQENERKHNEEITLMNRKIATLEELVQKLINEKPEQL